MGGKPSKQTPRDMRLKENKQSMQKPMMQQKQMKPQKMMKKGY
jgi:hypothetical protein